MTAHFVEEIRLAFNRPVDGIETANAPAALAADATTALEAAFRCGLEQTSPPPRFSDSDSSLGPSASSRQVRPHPIAALSERAPEILRVFEGRSLGRFVRPGVRRLTLVTAVLVAIALTLFLTAPFGKSVALAQANDQGGNSPATGLPTIGGTVQVGETLTADTSDIADAEGLENAAFGYQWVSSDGTTDTDIQKATDSTYKLVAADQGKSIKVRVSFTDDAGNEETLTSAPTEPVWGDGPPGAPGNLTITAGDQEITLSWEPPADNGNAPATRYRIEWRIDGKDYKKGHWGPSGETTYTKTDLANGVKYIFRVKAENGNGNSYGPYGPASEEVSATPTSGLAVDLGTPVLSNTKTLHHGMVKLDWEDVEDAGWYVVQYYHVKGGEWLDLPAAGVDIAFHGSSAVVSNLHGLSWLRVRAMSCALLNESGAVPLEGNGPVVARPLGSV